MVSEHQLKTAGYVFEGEVSCCETEPEVLAQIAGSNLIDHALTSFELKVFLVLYLNFARSRTPLSFIHPMAP